MEIQARHGAEEMEMEQARVSKGVEKSCRRRCRVEAFVRGVSESSSKSAFDGIVPPSKNTAIERVIIFPQQFTHERPTTNLI
mmetsp:Transcript_18799/g.30372  ORF Transcript_18799/g.30372 Transcript_18799/m.30372 type:complete len:82 (+) Transcript_18799:147-392(+)